jgi:hypothetical protein
MAGFVAGTDRGQATLLPECLDDWVDDSNPVRVSDPANAGIEVMVFIVSPDSAASLRPWAPINVWPLQAALTAQPPHTPGPHPQRYT